MDWFWTWGGKSFGYRVGDSLFRHDGLEVGRFYGDEVFGGDGRYLGEIQNDNRLIRSRSKSLRRQAAFTPRRGGSYVKYTNYVGYVMYAGYEDFPAPESF